MLAMPEPEAISYSRYSNLRQASGESEARQAEENEAIAASLGLPLNQNLVDRGLSAFTGMNRLKGAFGSLLRRLDAGQIAPGSVLIVEALDRISREDVNDALLQFLTLINKGLGVYTKRDKTLYTAEKLRSRDGMRLLFASIMEMVRSNEESEAKGERVRYTKSKRREAAAKEGRVATAVCPGWLEVVEVDGTRRFRPIPHRVALVRRVFDEVIAGVGVNTIARRLTREWKGGAESKAPWGIDRGRPATAWHGGTVAKIVNSRAVLGEWQPTERNKTTGGKVKRAGGPIPGYFGEGIIDLATFQRAQAAKSRNRTVDKRPIGGRRGNTFPNLLLGIAVCHRCLSRMVYRFANNPYLICDSYRRGAGCRERAHIRLDQLETAILDTVEDGLFEQGSLVPPSPRTRETEAELAALAEEVEFLNRRIGEVIRDKKMTYETISQIRAELSAERDSLLVRHREVAKRLTEERGVEGPAAHAEAVRRLRVTAQSSDLTPARYDARARINAALRELMTRIECRPDRQFVVLRGAPGFGFEVIGGRPVGVSKVVGPEGSVTEVSMVAAD